MIKFNKQKETTLNFNSLILLKHIDRELKKEIEGGWIQNIKFINNKEEQEFYEVSKVLLTYNKSMFINGKIIGYIEYDYQINSNTEDEWGRQDNYITSPSFKEFILLEKRQEFYENHIEDLNRELKENK